jgi:hypothetical protein
VPPKHGRQIPLFSTRPYTNPDEWILNDPVIKAVQASGMTHSEIARYVWGKPWAGAISRSIIPGRAIQPHVARRIVEACGYDPVDFDL